MEQMENSQNKKGAVCDGEMEGNGRREQEAKWW